MVVAATDLVWYDRRWRRRLPEVRAATAVDLQGRATPLQVRQHPRVTVDPRGVHGVGGSPRRVQWARFYDILCIYLCQPQIDFYDIYFSSWFQFHLLSVCDISIHILRKRFIDFMHYLVT
jgi:hypothetical protein